MRAAILGLAVSVQLLFPAVALACQDDSDCKPGSTCQKPLRAIFESLFGFCVGGPNPGNEHDRLPMRDPFDATGRKGDTCQYDLACGWGGVCVKEPGSTHGACL
jgi:hypothetical protein